MRIIFLLMLSLMAMSVSAQVKKIDYGHNAALNWKIAKAHGDSIEIFRHKVQRQFEIHRDKNESYRKKGCWDVEKDYDEKFKIRKP